MDLKKFLIINPFGIGDVLFTTPVIREIKENIPNSTVSYWCNNRVQEILKNNPRLEKVFALSKGDIKKIYEESAWEGIRTFLGLCRQIKQEKFDATIDFSLDHRYGLISKLLGIRKRVGFNYKNRGIFLTDKINIDGFVNKHIVEYNLKLLDFFGIKPKTKDLEAYASEYNKIRIKILLERAGINETDILVGIAPGAGASWGANASLKHWPAIKYAQLADMIIDRFNTKVLFLGDIAEKPIAEMAIAAMKNKALNLSGKTNLGEFIAVIKNLQLLITNDGGPLHIASACGIKTVSIFGPVDERVYGPYPHSKKHIVIKKDMECRPCYKKFRMNICDKNRECIDAITSQEVFEAAKKLL